MSCNCVHPIFITHGCVLLSTGLFRAKHSELIESFPSNVQEQVWTWINEGDEYFYDKLEWVRVRVEEEHWNDLSPATPSERGAESAAERQGPYSLVVRQPKLVIKVMLISLGFNDAIWSWTCRMVVTLPLSRTG